MNYLKAKVLLSAAVAAGLTCSDAAAAEFQVLHTFVGGLNDGYHPEQFVVDVQGGGIYGLLSSGGGASGALYRLGTDGGGYALIHSFATPDGTYPYKLTLSGSTLYGVTLYGGASSSGTIFRVQQDGSAFQVITNFASSGYQSPSDLAVYGSDIIGTTFSGGSHGIGSIYRVGTDGTGFANLHNFDVQAANVKGAAVLLGGQLYGATEINGANGKGTVYRVDADGSNFTVLHSFGGAGDGVNPEGGVLLAGGMLYGSAQTGGLFNAGVIYRMNLDGSGYTVLHSFTGGAGEGGKPLGTLQLVDGRLYGVTQSINSEAAAYFSLALDGSSFEQEYRFADGSFAPSTNFFVSGDAIYGVSPEFGSSTEAIFVVRGIPEPTVSWCLGVGAAGLLGVRRWRGQQMPSRSR